jgi:hypothetical protein
MQAQGFSAMTVNLDPGAERLPYSPEVDIRDWVRLSDVMFEYDLGPNGAQIIASDMLAIKANEVKEAIDEFEVDYVLIDTPGQIELFAFRDSSRIVIDTFGAERSLIAFLFDPVLSRNPSGFVSLLMLCASTQFRFNLPFINVLAKADLLSQEEIERIVGWSRDNNGLYEALLASSPGMQKEVSVESFKVLENLDTYRAVTPISSETNLGMDDLYNHIQQIFMGGEDLSID